MSKTACGVWLMCIVIQVDLIIKLIIILHLKWSYTGSFGLGMTSFKLKHLQTFKIKYLFKWSVWSLYWLTFQSHTTPTAHGIAAINTSRDRPNKTWIRSLPVAWWLERQSWSQICKQLKQAKQQSNNSLITTFRCSSFIRANFHQWHLGHLALLLV